MKNVFRLGLSVFVSFLILTLMLQLFTSGLSDQQRPNVFAALQSSILPLVLAYLGLYLVALLVRARRYSLLLSMSGEEQVPNFKQMVLVTGVRNMVVDLLPARLGELGYVALLNKGYNVKLEHCASSLAISVAFDFLAVVVIVLMILGKQLFGSGIEGWAITAMISALILAAIAMIGLFTVGPMFVAWLAKRFSSAPSSPSWLLKLIDLGEQFVNSLNQVRKAGRTLEVLGLSVFIRILKYAGLYLLFRAVANPSFANLADLPVEQVVSALIGGEVGASLPLPTFMSFGAYEAGTALVFQLLGVANQAAAFVTMLCVHIWSQLMEYIIGGVFLTLFIFLNRSVDKSVVKLQSDGSKGKASMMKWLGYGAAGFALLTSSAFLALELRAAKKLGSFSAPSVGKVSENEKDWLALSKAHVSNINGFVVFSSNRDGNHDIFKLNLADYELSKLTTHPHVETYPRISPNGQRLVFARSQQPWVSQRNSVAWDVYVLDLESMQETKMGSNGTAPQWLNNTEITYAREGHTLVKINVDDSSEEILYQTGVGNPMPKGAFIQNPEYNPITKQVVFTARQSHIGTNTGHWGTALTTGDTHRGILNGCELAWTSDHKGLFQVTTGGRDGDIKIVRVDPVSGEGTTLIDTDIGFGHEYWPKDSSNGEYMVYGASRSRQEHEHDTEDYEIFLWKVGSDSSKATRLTFHTGNDNWPDVYIE